MLTQIAELIEGHPWLQPLVKEAEDWSTFPVGNQSQTVFSYILADHLQKRAEIFDIPEHVKRAFQMRKVRNPEISRIVDRIAQDQLPKMQEDSFQAFQKQAEENYLEKSAEEIKDIAEQYGYEFTDASLSIKAGQKGFHKEAAITALEARFAARQDERYVSLRELIEKEAENIEPSKAWVYAAAIERLDAETGLNSYGFNFSKEASLHRSVLKVKLHQKEVPVENLLAYKKHIEDMVGDKLPDNPQELKVVIDTLPLDLKKLIERHVPA